MQAQAEAAPTPILRWAGGKRRLLPAIAAELGSAPDLAHVTYVEPFLGGAAVFLSLAPRLKRKAILGDQNVPLVKAYGHLTQDCEYVIDALRRTTRDFNEMELAERRAEYNRIRDRLNRALTSIDSAGRQLAHDFIFLNMAGFNGIYRTSKAGLYNVPLGTRDKVLSVDANGFRAAARAFSKSHVKPQGFSKTLEDLPDDHRHIIYCDPPYTVKHNNNGFIEYNQELFEWEDQEKLADLASTRAAMGDLVIISNAAHEEIAALYPERLFRVNRLTRPSTIGATLASRGRFGEFLITSKVKLK